MITTLGKAVVVNFFGAQVPHIGDTIAVGTGTTAAALTDTALAAEVIRVKVTSISADTANNRIIFKAVIQPGTVTTISEVGVFYDGFGPGATLVARDVLATPATVDPSIPTEIEYSLEVSV